MAGLVAPAEAVAVAVPGLLLGVWLTAGPTSHAPLGRAGVRGAVPAGWVLVVLSVALVVLALSAAPATTSGTRVPHSGPGVTRTATTAAHAPVPGGPG